MFGISKDTIVEQSNIIQTLEPGIYSGMQLKEVTFGNAEKKDGSQGKQIINFTFTDGNLTHVHTEWETDDSKKAENLSKRVVSIMTKFGIEKSVFEKNFATFKEFGEFVAGLKPDDSKATFKIVGSVYNGRASAGFPNYTGFIVPDGTPLKFSAKEIQSNNDYKDFNAGGSADDALTPDASEAEQLDFLG